MNYDTYRDDDELRYFGSDLNKFIHYHCDKQMDTINIDCLQYKSSQTHLRIIEYKHSNEELSKRQKVLLPMLARFLKFSSGRSRFPFTVYTVYSDPPDFNGARVVDMLTKKEVTLQNVKDVKKWLNFEIDLRKERR